MKKLNATLIPLAAVLIACQSMGTVNAVPAHLVNVNETSRAELQTAIAGLLNQPQVLIAADAFTTSSVLILERQAHRDGQGNRIQGREIQAPEKIELQLVNEKCVLRRVSNEKTVELKHTTCIKE